MVTLTVCLMFCLLSFIPVIFNIQLPQMTLSVILIVINSLGLALTMLPYFYPFVSIGINLYIASAFFVINIASETSLLFEQKFAHLATIFGIMSLFFSVIFTVMLNRKELLERPWNIKNYLRNAFLASAIICGLFGVDYGLSTNISWVKIIDYSIFGFITTNIFELIDRRPKQNNLVMSLMFIMAAFFINFINIEILANNTLIMSERIDYSTYRNLYLVFTTFVSSGFYFYIRSIIVTAEERTNLLKTIGKGNAELIGDQTDIDGYFSVNVSKMSVMEFSENAGRFLGLKTDSDLCSLGKKDPYGLIPIIEKTISSGTIESTKLNIGDKSYNLNSVKNQSESESTVLFHITDITKQEQGLAEEKQRSRMLEMLVDIANSASKRETIEQLCKYTISSITSMLDFEYGVIFIVDNITDSVEIYSDNATSFMIGHHRQLQINLEDRSTLNMLCSKTEYFFDSSIDNPKDPYQMVAKSMELGSMIIMPFQINHEKSGCCVIGSRRIPLVKPSMMQLTKTITTQLGMALDRHMLLETLKQRYKLVENANRTKDELITMIGHELKTPLTSIVGYIELFDIDKDNLTQKQREFITILHHQSDILSWLVSGINLLALLKTNRYTPEKENVALDKVIQRMQGRFTRPENKNETTITCNVNEKTIINTDITAFLGICTNLLIAFERFSNLDSRIDLSISRLDHDVSIEISDNSKPIGNEDLEKIYEIFSTLQTKPSTINRGSVGLPLSIVKEFTDLLGGSIRFDSLSSGNKAVVILPGVFQH